MIKAVIADDSPLLRQVLKDVLEKSKEIIVIGMALNGKAAIEIVKNKKPDILILDCEMPVMNGLEALKIIMEENPLPVFVFSSHTFKSSITTIRALELGAIDYLLKPSGGVAELEAISNELISKIKYVVAHGQLKIKAKGATVDIDRKNIPTDINGVNTHLNTHPNTHININKSDSNNSLKDLKPRKFDIVAMGSSTGGVQAATKIIPLLRENLPPIVWVQHMPEHFTASLAKRLNELSKIEVKEAENGEVIKRGTCYLAPGGHQMRVIKSATGYKLQIAGEEKICGHCPSCTNLFESVAEHFTNNSLGLILTGMGEDGSTGLLDMHKRGAYIIGQNEKSCTVYGMPKAAFKIGAVDIELDLNMIADGINHLCIK
ncbi:MAG: chemotaxis response regulator protein-glutamate methylesterase [Oligoflexia bacterium]|nr:chemotaxis response regulator protein-glutamate methylesterase [Oligoflexia bacterium]